MSVKLLTEHHLEFLSLKWGCTGSSEPTLVKMPHCWKSHVAAHLKVCKTLILSCIVEAFISYLLMDYNTVVGHLLYGKFSRFQCFLFLF